MAQGSMHIASARRAPHLGFIVRKWMMIGYVAAFFCALYLPIGLLVFLSVNDSSTMAASFGGFTGRWYATVFSSPPLLRSIFSSMWVGFVSSAVAVTLAVSLALGLRQDFPLKRVLIKLVLVPILVPGIVVGVVSTMYFGFLGVPNGLWTTVLPTHITWVLPFAFLTIFPRLHGFDRALEDAAMDLGATRAMVFRRVLWPLLRPSIFATFLFGFTISFDEFIRTFFVVSHELTVPVHLWQLLSNQMAPFLPAVGVLITVISVVASLSGFLASAWAQNRTSPIP
jgi:ABC-type spermidine/putrescine transport system permease subunit II